MEELLKEMLAAGAAANLPLVRAREVACLQSLVRQKRPRRILELGTAIGYSALLLAEAAPEAKITTIELHEELAARAAEFISRSPHAANIRILVGDAGKLLADNGVGLVADGETAPPRFDFVFIDAAKGQYPDYWRKIQPLLSTGAVVVADDILYHGYVQGAFPAPRRERTIVKRLREYIDLVTNDERFATEIVARGDGLAISRRR